MFVSRRTSLIPGFVVLLANPSLALAGSVTQNMPKMMERNSMAAKKRSDPKSPNQCCNSGNKKMTVNAHNQLTDDAIAVAIDLTEDGNSSGTMYHATGPVAIP